MVLTENLRNILEPLMPKQNDDSRLQEDQELYLTCTFLCPVKLMLRISNYFLHLVETTLSQFHSLIPLKRNSPFMRSLFKEHQSGKWSETFYIDIKTIERVKKQAMFQRKTADFKSKYPENYKDRKCTIYKILSLYKHLCSTFSISVLVCL